MDNALFPIYYCPPLSWFAAACQESAITLEVMQPYRKQLYTNRMHIRVSNRVMALSIPIERRGARVPIRDKKITYQESWQRQHVRSIQFAYKNSPYYEYYADYFSPFYEKKYEWLVDFNLEWMQRLFSMLKMEVEVGLTDIFEEEVAGVKDYRNDFDPTRKKKPIWFNPKPYFQVFEGFEADLSIIDLLCNEGPESKILLKEMFIPTIS